MFPHFVTNIHAARSVPEKFVKMKLLLVVFCSTILSSAALDTVSSTLSKENPENCVIDPPHWTKAEDVIYQEDYYKFVRQEEELFRQCRELPTFYLIGDFVMPDPCQAMTLCNSTYCLQFQPEALLHFYTVPLTCLNKLDIDSDNSQFMYVEDTPRFKVFSIFHLFDLLTNARFDKKKYYFETFTRTVSTRVNFHYASKYCPNVAEKNYFLEGLGELPSQCSRVKFCNAVNNICYSVPLSSMKYAFIFPRKEDPDYKNLALPATCHVMNLDRARRHISVFTEYGMSKQPSRYGLDNSFGVLNFNLPGFRYCGPGRTLCKHKYSKC